MGLFDSFRSRFTARPTPPVSPPKESEVVIGAEDVDSLGVDNIRSYANANISFSGS